jgi:glycosyltransferase involved in cell wall biosynthesis
MQYCEFPQDLSVSALWATRFLVPLALRVARRVITLSEFSRRQITRYVGMASEKIIPIHLAAGPEFSQMMTGDEGKTRRAALIPPEPYVFCVANTYPHKNVHSLVEAFGLLADQSEVNLVLVGVERRGESLVKAALDRMPPQHRERVKRLRGLDRRDLVALYQGAAVFAFPSLYEGFGLPVLEAMAAGVPVVTTERGPMREIGGDTIQYCDGTSAELARHLNELLKLEGATREEVIRNAKARASTFTWEKTADQTVAALSEASRSIG